MEILPPNPKLVRKFPVPRPYGNPTGPMSLVNPKDGYPAISAGLRRSASEDKFVSSATLAQAPHFLNVPPSQLAQVPRYLNVPPSQLGQSPLTTPMVNQPALDPTKLRELQNTYAAENFSGNYVDQIKLNVRYDYGENPYFGYSTARRNAQFENPSFMASSYNYPDIFQRRGVSLAGLGNVAPGMQAQVVLRSGNLNVRSANNKDSSVMGVLPNGTVVTVAQVASGTDGSSWSYIQFGNLQGWVASQFLQPYDPSFVGPPAPPPAGNAPVATSNNAPPAGVPPQIWSSLASFAPSGTGLAAWWNSQSPAMQAWWVSFVAASLGMNVPPIPGVTAGGPPVVQPPPPGVDVNAANAAQRAINIAPRRDNTALYVGLGVVGVFTLGILLVVATRKR